MPLGGFLLAQQVRKLPKDPAAAQEHCNLARRDVWIEVGSVTEGGDSCRAYAFVNQVLQKVKHVEHCCTVLAFVEDRAASLINKPSTLTPEHRKVLHHGAFTTTAGEDVSDVTVVSECLTGFHELVPRCRG